MFPSPLPEKVASEATLQLEGFSDSNWPSESFNVLLGVPRRSGEGGTCF